MSTRIIFRVGASGAQAGSRFNTRPSSICSNVVTSVDLPPGGAYYVIADVEKFGFTTDTEFAQYLVKEIGVATVPGSSFYIDSASAPKRCGSASRRKTRR